MFSRVLKKTSKALVAVCISALVLHSSDKSARIGNEDTDVSGAALSTEDSVIFEAYSEIEKRASSLIPSEVSRALSKISEWITEFFGTDNGL